MTIMYRSAFELGQEIQAGRLSSVAVLEFFLSRIARFNRVLVILFLTLQVSPIVAAPNIILIVADDLGYGHLGSYGQTQISTPHLDTLARQGMRFTQFYAGAPICAPSRATLMQGLHTGRASVRGNTAPGPIMSRVRRWSGGIDLDAIERSSWMQWVFKRMFTRAYEMRPEEIPLPTEIPTMARVLKERGYRTAAFGKWGLGGVGSTGQPNRQGFDRFYGLLSHIRAHNHYPSEVWRNRDLISVDNAFFSPHRAFAGDDPGNPDDPGYFEGIGSYWMDDLSTDQAIDFINNDSEQPFFIYLPLLTPHAALQVPEDALAKYLGKFPEVPYVTHGMYMSRSAPRAMLAAMISRMDANVGRLVAEVDRLGLGESTLILFTSDNGPSSEGGLDVEFFNANGPLRGKKLDLYEGGIRVPLLARWPGTIPAGAENTALAAFWDLLPTLSDVSGQPYSGDTDGISLMTTLMGNAPPARDALYWEYHDGDGEGVQAIRSGNWKAIRFNTHRDPNGPVVLYDLAKDVGETNDLAAEHPEVAARLAQKMQDMHTPTPVAGWNF